MLLKEKKKTWRICERMRTPLLKVLNHVSRRRQKFGEEFKRKTETKYEKRLGEFQEEEANWDLINNILNEVALETYEKKTQARTKSMDGRAREGAERLAQNNKHFGSGNKYNKRKKNNEDKLTREQNTTK